MWRWSGAFAAICIHYPVRPVQLRVDRLLAVTLSCWQAHVQADLGTVAAGADLDQIAQLMHYP